MRNLLYFLPPMTIGSPDKVSEIRYFAERCRLHLEFLSARPTTVWVQELRDFWNPIGAIVESSADFQDVDPRVFGTLPTIFLNRDPATLPPQAFSVFHDQRATARLAARELIADGFRHFAYIPYRENTTWSAARERGFTEALEADRFAAEVFHPTADGETARVAELRDFLAKLPRPCGIFAANDATAEAVLTAASLAGLAVPDDLAVLGVDNLTSLCEHTHPPLSSIEPDFRRGAQLAIMLLMAAVRDGRHFHGSRHRAFGDLGLVRRESTPMQQREDREVREALGLIRREACSGLMVGRVAATFACSARHAHARFRKATGRTILQAIHAVQLERAKELIRETDMPLKVISDFCGFGNANSLRKFFRRETGKTMSQERAQPT